MSKKTKQWRLRRFTDGAVDYYGGIHMVYPACEITDENNNVILSSEKHDTIRLDDADWDLIAAAPEMLEALKAAAEYVGKMPHPDFERGADVDAIYAQCIAAIAKAEGKLDF